MDYVFPAEIAALRARKSGKFQELAVLEWIKAKNLRGTYIDVGAHVGNHSLFFLNHCLSEQVISIEAHPTIRELLKGNIKRNAKMFTNWECCEAAAWHSDNEHVLLSVIPRNNAGHTHVVTDIKQASVKVPTIRVDSLILESKPVVLKIDVEDVEEQVIAGAQNVLAQHPVVIAERHTSKQLADFEVLLEPFGYKRTMEWSPIHTYSWEATC